MNIFYKKEVLFVKFPMLFPILYGLILYTFPELETALIFFTILILAESHFGATWPFFINKVNYNYIKERKTNLIIIPIVLIFFCIGGFFLFKSFFLLIFFTANVYHVTRQSNGIMSLYIKDNLQNKTYTSLIYLFNLIFFLIGFFRFYYPIINEENLFYLNILIVFILISVLFIQNLKFGFSENSLTLITGILIFYPICFVTNPVHAIIMGVTMHYSQYLYLTSKVIKKRSEENISEKGYFKKFLIIIFAYSIIMSLFSVIGKYDESLIFLKNLLLIPITGQMLHFYLDTQLWKFSEPHNKKNVLKYIL